MLKNKSKEYATGSSQDDSVDAGPDSFTLKQSLKGRNSRIGNTVFHVNPAELGSAMKKGSMPAIGRLPVIHPVNPQYPSSGVIGLINENSSRGIFNSSNGRIESGALAPFQDDASKDLES